MLISVDLSAILDEWNVKENRKRVLLRRKKKGMYRVELIQLAQMYACIEFMKFYLLFIRFLNRYWYTEMNESLCRIHELGHTNTHTEIAQGISNSSIKLK